jgi:UDP-3-O-[3-hydroxymyristoyl] glucosamine N-acyltransferase
LADSRFFSKIKVLTLKNIVEISQGELINCQNHDKVIDDVAPLDQAQSSHLSFFDNKKYLDQFKKSHAGVCLIHHSMRSIAPDTMIVILCDDPYRSYAKVAKAFYPDNQSNLYISDRSLIDPSVKFGKNVTIEAGAVLEKNVVLGDHVRIGANSVICQGVVIGDETIIEPSCTISHAIIGHRVRVFPGVRIGQDGFGYAMGIEHIKIPQLGRVIIEDEVEIGANTTIDRGAGPDTIIGKGTKIDNLVQIGHNVQIGQGCIIVSQTGISGSTKLGRYVVLGGQAGIAGHLKLGDGAKVAAQGGVLRDIPDRVEVGGSPAVPLMDWLRQSALLAKLIRKKNH